MKQLVKKALATFVALTLCAMPVSVAVSANEAAAARPVVYSLDVPIGDFLIRIERLTPHEVLGVITVEYEAAVWTGESMEYQHLSETFSVVLIPDTEPYFLVRYTPINSDGIYMNLREISLHGGMRGGAIFSVGDGPLGREDSFYTANNPLYIRFGEILMGGEMVSETAMWYGIFNAEGILFDSDIDSWMEGVDISDWSAYSAARSSAWATGTIMFSNYIVMTPSQLSHFNTTGVLPFPYRFNWEGRQRIPYRRYTFEEWDYQHSFSPRDRSMIEALTDLLAGLEPQLNDSFAPTYIIAQPSAHSVILDGETINPVAFNIDGSNFFMLRDIAYMLNGTAAQFEVTWDEELNAINLLTGQTYTPVGIEMAQGAAQQTTATSTTAAVYIDGTRADLRAYNIDGSNFFMLRDLGDVLGFGVEWDSVSGAIVISSGESYDTSAHIINPPPSIS